jgi:hypothetical protein
MYSLGIDGVCRPFDGEVVDEMVSRLSSLRLDLIRLHFRCNPRAFEEAFEMFANGGLRYWSDDLGWVGEPTSAFFFCFGEFGLSSSVCG